MTKSIESEGFMNWLKVFYAEQTTADEMVIFLLLGTFFTLLIAFTIYALVLFILSRWRMEKKVSLWLLFFPPVSSMRKYIAEYTMSTVTALLLTLSVTIKHQQVDQVLTQDIGLIGQSLVRSVIKYDDPTELEASLSGLNSSEEKLLSWLQEESSKKAGVTAQQVISPLLAQGMSDQADLIVRTVVKNLTKNDKSLIDISGLEKILVIISILLLVSVAVWFGWQRWKGLKTHGAGKLAYNNIIKKLAVPAVCIPLLLISSVALQDSERLINSAMAKASLIEQQREVSDPQQSQYEIRNDIDINNFVINLLDKSRQRGVDHEKSLLENIELTGERITHINRQLESFSNKVEDLKKRLNDAETSMVRLNKLGNENTAEHLEFNKFFTILRSDLASFKTQTDSFTTDLNAVNMNQNVLEKKQVKVQQELTQHQTALESLDKRVTAIELSIKSALAKANAANDKYVTLKSKHKNDILLLTKKHDKNFLALKKRLDILEKSQHAHSVIQ